MLPFPSTEVTPYSYKKESCRYFASLIVLSWKVHTLISVRYLAHSSFVYSFVRLKRKQKLSSSVVFDSDGSEIDMDLLVDTDAMCGHCTHPLAIFSTHTASSPTSTQLTLPQSVAQGTLPLQSVQAEASLPVSTSFIQHSTLCLHQPATKILLQLYEITTRRTCLHLPVTQLHTVPFSHLAASDHNQMHSHLIHLMHS